MKLAARALFGPRPIAGASILVSGLFLWGYGASSSFAEPPPSAKPPPPGAAAPPASSASGAPRSPAAPGGGSAAPRSSAAPSASAVSATPAAPAAPQRAVPAVSKVADAIAQGLGKVPARALVVTSALVSDPPAPKGDRLALAVAAQVAGRFENGAHAQSEVLGLAAARAAAATHSAPVLVQLAVEIASGKLRVTADLYPVPKTVWSKIRDPEPAPIVHAFAEALIDAEVRSYLPAIPLVTPQVDRGRNFESEVVALACGDLDRDGSSEIATVSRRRVTTSRIRGGKVEPLRGKGWIDLSPVSPAPLREPYAFASLVERGAGPDARTTLDVGLTDRALSIRFDRGLEVDSTFAGLPIPDGAGVACTRMSALVVTGPIGACKKGDPAPLGASVGGQYDAFASAALVDAGGAPFVVWAGRERGIVELRDDASHAARVPDMGAQLAVGDLDQDGDPEILGSVDTLNALDDAVVVKTWRRGTGKVEERLRIPAAAGVHALGVCPPDGPGHTPFLVATADEIWVVR